MAKKIYHEWSRDGKSGDTIPMGTTHNLQRILFFVYHRAKNI